MAGCGRELLGLVLVCTFAGVYSVAMDDFYPFGFIEGDLELPPAPSSNSSLVVSRRVDLPMPVFFYAQEQNSLYINSQGVLSFGNFVLEAEPQPFPGSVPVIAPYWDIVDLKRGGSVYYRTSNEPDLLQQAQDDVLSQFPDLEGVFVPTSVFVATWLEVQEFQGEAETNTFQCVLVTDGVRSFALFLYLDEGIQWGQGAQIGLDVITTPFGGPINNSDIVPLNFSLPGALTNQSVDIELTENTGIVGKWTFRLDIETIVQPGELPLKVFLGTSSGPTMNISIDESIGNTSLCIFTLVLAGNESSVQDFSVNIFTTDGTAIAGENYVPIEETVFPDMFFLITENAGVSTDCVNLQVLDDNLVGDNKVLMVSIQPQISSKRTVFMDLLITIINNDIEVQQFGESFPFGGSDVNLQLNFNNFFPVFLSSPFTFYGQQEDSLFINENGILSFQSPFTSPFVRSFESLFTFSPLIAPLWANLDTSSETNGLVLLRISSDQNIMERASNLTKKQFPSINFEPTDVVIVTWLDVGTFSTQSGVNTFQVALIYNNNVSFVFFFYDEINIDSRSVNIGFRSPNNNNGGESFMLPGVLSGSTELNLTSTGNTDIPGFFAYRVDLNFIVQPQDIVASFDQEIYRVSEDSGVLQVCVSLLGRLEESVTITVLSLDNETDNSNDYEEVFISLVFNASSSNTQCLNVIILDDEIFELQEGFSLMLEPSLASIRIGSNASVFILDNEIGQFGESFLFGPSQGDDEARPIFDSSVFLSLPFETPFIFYGLPHTFININENGVISFRGSFRNNIPRDFDSRFLFPLLIAPFWSNIDLNRFGRIFYRLSNDSECLDRVGNLTSTLFPGTEFQPTSLVIVTWYQVAESTFDNSNESNSFQAVLASNGMASFVYYFYGDIQWGRFSNIGFSPSSISSFSLPGSESFMIPIALTNATIDIEVTSNSGVPGLYAFRVDRSIITQPDDVVLSFEQITYSVNESEASIEVCIVVEGTANVSVLVMSLSNNSAEVELDYMEVFELLFFGVELDSRQCLDIIIFDDSTFEGDENFILTLQAENVDALTMNTSIIILDDDAGSFGESFPFGESVGDINLLIPFNRNFFVFLSSPFSFYGRQNIFFQINENGVLSFDGAFRNTFIQDFDEFFHFQSLIAPLWTDLDLNRFGGRIMYRTTTDLDTLERARNLTQQQFPGVDFEPMNVIIVTWYEVGHRFFGDSDVNTFQAALVYNNATSFAFFFYNQTSVGGFRVANAGFSDRSVNGNGESFTIPGVLSGDIPLEDGDNTGISGFYAYRVDSSFIVEPSDLVIAFDQAVYIFNETEGSFQVCISLETNTVVDNVTVEVQSTSDGSAMEFSDYEPVSVTLSFGGGITNQCFNVIILDDFIIENEENFSLILEPAFQDEITLVGILNVSVIIIDDDVGQFGESFEFGGAIGDSSLSRSSTFNFLDIPFPFYERQERILFINENGILSFDGSFQGTFIQDFDDFIHFQPLIAPLWTDLDINRSGGSIFFRVTTDMDTLERASDLTQQQFSDLDFEPTSAIIVTWFEVGHSNLPGVNTFQVALINNNDTSFALFFYNNISIQGTGLVNIGFSSSSFRTGESFMIPGVLSGTVDIVGGSNTEVSGFYAYRVDQGIITEPGDIVPVFEQSRYTVLESDGYLEVCVFLQGNVSETVTLQISTSDDTDRVANTTVCTQGDIRLQGGTRLQGRVEVCNNNVWGTVCDDIWGAVDATVACRQLGFSDQGAVALQSGFADGTGPIFLDDVQCTGTEDNLFSCPHNGIGIHNCAHSEDAGVRCQPAQSAGTQPAAPEAEDYVPVSVTLIFDEGSDSTQCFNITIIDDEEMEDTEEFFLITESTSSIQVSNVSVSIIDDDVGQFGESFPFGRIVGDMVARPVFDRSIPVFLSLEEFIIYGQSHRLIFINENGVISFGGSFPSSSPRDFDSVSFFGALIAPFWSNINLNRSGTIFYRQTQSMNDSADGDLQRATNLTRRFFPNLEDRVNNVVVITWDRVPEFNAMDTDRTNSFQAVLVSASNSSFVYFFYGEMEWGEFSNIGFDPPRFESGSESFMIPIALTNATVNIETTSNVGMPGVYVFRVDRMISQVGDISASFEQNAYFVTEGEQLLVCVNIDDFSINGNVILIVISQSGSAQANTDFEDIEIALTFGPGFSNRQCFNVSIFDDNVFESDERFFLILSGERLNAVETSILIENTEVGVFGASFQFGSVVGDQTARPLNDEAFPIFLQLPVEVYDVSSSSLWVNENGILSFFRPFSSNSPRNFSSVFSIGTLIAPFWSNIDLRQFGVIYYRAVTNGSDLLRATQLINELFPSVVTIVNEVTVVTWFEVAEATFNSTNSESNTFQVVLVTSTNGTFVFFFYGDIEWGTFSNIGFRSSLFSRVRESFMIPIALTNATEDIETTSNVAIPGFYAFRVDSSIQQPQALIQFEADTFNVSESNGSVQVCVSEGGLAPTDITYTIQTLDGTAKDGRDYISIFRNVTYSGRNITRCFNVTIINDTIFESQSGEIFFVQIQFLTAVLTANIIITDDDLPLLSFNDVSYQVAEDVADSDLAVYICVILLEEIEEFFSATLTSSSLAAIDSVDYLPHSEILTFDRNTSSAQCVCIAILQDDIVEYPEDFLVTLRGKDINLPTISAEVTISDDDDFVEVGFEMQEYTLSEGGDSIEVCVLMLGTTERTINFKVKIQNRSASITDFLGITSAIIDVSIFGSAFNGITNQRLCQSVEAFDDAIYEGTEYLTAIIEANDTFIKTFNTTANLTVLDNEDRPPAINFVNDSPRIKGSYVVAEFSLSNGELANNEMFQCQISQRSIAVDCSSGVFKGFLPLSVLPFRLTINLVRDNVTILTTSRVFRVETRVCWLHPINKGVTVSRNNVTVEWQVTGPSRFRRATNLVCQLDGGKYEYCASPYMKTGLNPGNHTVAVQVASKKSGCLKLLKRLFNFTIL